MGPQYQGAGIEDWRWKKAFGRLSSPVRKDVTEAVYESKGTMEDGLTKKMTETYGKKES
jgi:hypothetical protein